MNGGQTNVRVVGIAGAITAIMFWLLGYFEHPLMMTAPPGLEAAVTTLIAALVGRTTKPDALMNGKNNGVKDDNAQTG